MTPIEANYIIMIEALEKDDLMDPDLANRYILSAQRRDYSASFISDPIYAEMARSLAAWDRKVANAIKMVQDNN